MPPDMEPQRPPFRILILYSLGQFGWSLGTYGVSNLLTYFYMPPETGNIFPSFIYQGPVLAIFTLIGLVSAGGRFVDAFIDPFIAFWSDRNQSKMGKRRFFLLWGAIPLALSGYLVFQPWTSVESLSNFFWLVIWLTVYYFFVGFYVIPYTALIAELGHNQRDRMQISTMISITWALGFVAGNSALAIQSSLEKSGMPPTSSFQFVIGGMAVISAIFMLLPALFLPEKRYARHQVSDAPLKESIGVVLGNKNFKRFLASDLMYWLALNFIQIGMAYYATLLFGLDKSYVFNFSVTSFVTSFLFYGPINWLARRYGKKPLMMTGFALFAFLFAGVALAQDLPVSKIFLLYAIAVGSAFPLAVFGILPNALIGDVVDYEERTTGRPLAGMYYGIRAFVMKVAVSVGNLVFPSLLQFGKSEGNPLGVQLTAWVALVFCIVGWVAFRSFQPVPDEKISAE